MNISIEAKSSEPSKFLFCFKFREVSQLEGKKLDEVDNNFKVIFDSPI